jgi:hypothetical protein
LRRTIGCDSVGGQYPVVPNEPRLIKVAPLNSPNITHPRSASSPTVKYPTQPRDSHDPPHFFHSRSIHPNPTLSRPRREILPFNVKGTAAEPRRNLMRKCLIDERPVVGHAGAQLGRHVGRNQGEPAFPVVDGGCLCEGQGSSVIRGTVMSAMTRGERRGLPATTARKIPNAETWMYMADLTDCRLHWVS